MYQFWHISWKYSSTLLLLIQFSDTDDEFSDMVVHVNPCYARDNAKQNLCINTINTKLKCIG